MKTKKINFKNKKLWFSLLTITGIAGLGILAYIIYSKNSEKIPEIIKLPKNQLKITSPVREVEYLVHEIDIPFYNEIIRHPLEINIQEDYQDQPEDYGFLLEYFGNINVPIDTQNIHDTQVQSKITEEYTKLKDNQENQQNKPVLDNSIIERAKTEEDQRKIRTIIDNIKHRNAFVSNINEKEYDTLHRTWNASNELQKDQIINELLDSQNGDRLYCPTGVVSRIISSQFITDPDNYPKPASIYKQEMIDKASSVYKDYCKEVDPDKSYKEHLMQVLKEDYLDILSEDEIINCTKEWIDSI